VIHFKKPEKKAYSRVTSKRKPKAKKQMPEESHWQVFERNGSIGAFLMFHRTKAQARVVRRTSRKTSSR
jgi:hypothetical protein